MAIKMLATFKTFKAGSIVDPDESTTAWLISRQYAVPSAAEPETTPAKPAPMSKGRK